MIDPVIIQSSNSPAQLILSAVEGDEDYIAATIEDTGLSATSHVDAFLAESLVGLFERMAVDWKGWQGILSAETIDHDLILSCRSDSTGHAFVIAELRIQKEQGWTARINVRIDSGQYASIAQQLKAFFTQIRDGKT